MLIGHSDIFNRLDKLFKIQRQGSFLFSGPEKIGKKKLAMELAEGILGKDNRQDLLVVLPEKSQIIIDQVRQISKFFTLKPSQGFFRIVIVDDIHLLRTEAANAFLKTLEVYWSQ